MVLGQDCRHEFEVKRKKGATEAERFDEVLEEIKGICRVVIIGGLSEETWRRGTELLASRCRLTVEGRTIRSSSNLIRRFGLGVAREILRYEAY
jgi:hypothetical protein